MSDIDNIHKNSKGRKIIAVAALLGGAALLVVLAVNTTHKQPVADSRKPTSTSQPIAAPPLQKQPSCSDRDGNNRTTEFLETADDSGDACQYARDLIQILRHEVTTGVSKICGRLDNASADEIATVRKYIASGNPQAQQMRMCLPENRSKTIAAALPKPTIYSFGQIVLDGKACPAYLYVQESAEAASKIVAYRPRFLGHCAGQENRFENESFLPDRRPNAPYLGDLLKEVNYTGALPNTWVYQSKSYIFTSNKAETPAGVAATESNASPITATKSVDSEDGQTGAATPGAHKFYYLEQGAVICTDIKGIHAADAVLQSGNAYAEQLVLEKYGCELMSRRLEFDARDTLLRDLDDRFVAITGNKGFTVLTKRESVSVEYHDQPQLTTVR